MVWIVIKAILHREALSSFRPKEIRKLVSWKPALTLMKTDPFAGVIERGVRRKITLARIPIDDFAWVATCDAPTVFIDQITPPKARLPVTRRKKGRKEREIEGG